MSHNRPESKRISLESAAKVFNQFSPPQLIYPETRQVAEGDFSGLSPKLKLEDTDRERLQNDAAEYRKYIRGVRRELGHRTLLIIANDLTERRESGLYVDNSSIRLGNLPKNEIYDLSAVNWEYTPDGYLTRNRSVRSSGEVEFGVWDMKYVESAHISNAIRESDGTFGQETLRLDDADDTSITLAYSMSTDHMRKRPFHDAFRKATSR